MAINLCYQCLPSQRLEVLLEDVRWNADAVEELLDPEQRSYTPLGAKLRTEGSWYDLHALLSVGQWQDQPLLAAALSGGTGIGRDFAYGPPRYLIEARIKEISAALQLVSEVELKETFDFVSSTIAEVPFSTWTASDFVYLWQTFFQVRDFFLEAARDREAMLLWIC